MDLGAGQQGLWAPRWVKGEVGADREPHERPVCQPCCQGQAPVQAPLQPPVLTARPPVRAPTGCHVPVTAQPTVFNPTLLFGWTVRPISHTDHLITTKVPG